MARKIIPNSEKFYFTYPNTVAVISVHDQGKNWVMPSVWQIPFSYKPLLVGTLVSPTRATYEHLLTAEDFTLNYFTLDQAQLVTWLGSTSGRDVDKTEKFNLAFSESQSITSPFLTDAVISLECKKAETKKYGDHVLFVGEVTTIWGDEQYVDGTTVNFITAEPLLYLGNMTYTTLDHTKITVCQKSEF